MNTQLIEQLKAGIPLHNDIDNVELLRNVCFEAGKCYPFSANGKFYKLGKWFWYCTDTEPNECIKLSSFLPKMVEVEVIRQWVNDNTETATIQAGDKITFVHVEDINNFLNEQ